MAVQRVVRPDRIRVMHMGQAPCDVPSM